MNGLSIVFLQLGAAERVAQKAAHMTEIDPHGTTLTIVCVVVVFAALLILDIAYSISGAIFKRKRENQKALRPAHPDNAVIDEDEAAAIAVALDAFIGEEECHDTESGIITIKDHFKTGSKR